MDCPYFVPRLVLANPAGTSSRLKIAYGINKGLAGKNGVPFPSDKVGK